MTTAVPARPAAASRSRGAVLRALYFLFYASGAFWSPFFTIYLRQVGLSGLQIGALTGIRPAIAMLGQPLWGMVADMRGRRRTLIATMFLAGTLILGYAWPGGFWYLLAWTVIYAFLTNPVGTLIDSLVLDHLDERRSSTFGQLRLWGAAGWAVSALVAGRIMAALALPWMFPAAGLIMATGALVAWRGTRETTRRASVKRSWRGAGALLRNRQLVTFLVLVTCVQIGAGCLNSFYPVYMDELGTPRTLLGFAYTLQGLSELPLYLASGWIIRKLGARRTLVLTFTASAARVLLYSVIRVPALAVSVELMHGLCFSLYLVAAVGYVNRLVPSEWRATGQSLLSAAYFGAGGILANLWAGFLYDHIGIRMTFRVNGFIILTMALLALLILRERKAPARSAAA